MDNLTVPASGNLVKTYTVPTISGYTCVGIAEYAISNATSNGIGGSRAYFVQNTIGTINLGNRHETSDLKVKAIITLLYIKNIT